jgi:hypothetical protein
MESSGEYGKSKTVDDAVSEGNRRAAKREEENNVEQDVRGNFCFASLRDIVELCLVCGSVCFVSLKRDKDDWKQS